MKKDPQNLKIRVVMKPTATGSGSVPGQYRTNWARVAVVAVPVLLVLGLLSAKFLFDGPGAPPSSDLVLDSNALDTQADDKVTRDPTPTTVPEAKEASLPPPAVAELEKVEGEDVADGPPESPQLDQSQEEPELTTEASPDEASPAPTSVASETPVPEVSTSQAAAMLQAGETRVISPKVKRFQLAAGIRDKEPRGALEDINDHDSADGVLTVYVFAEVINMKDSKIRYRWLRNGVPTATVKVGVWSNKYRSHSSKYITRGMRGDWQVRLENSQGELLAEATFHY